jgi:hypothetical protein
MRRMKLSHSCPPLAALLLVGAGIGLQRRGIAELEVRNQTLRQRIESAEHSADSASVTPTASPMTGLTSITGKSIDWRKTAMLKAYGGNEDVRAMRAMLELQQTLLALSPQQLLAQLDEIAALDLPGEAKREFENLILQILGQKDPLLALDRFAGRLGSNRSDETWRLTMIFQQWTAKDAGAAAAWMDKQIEAGAFESKSLEGKNENRKNFEATLIREWVSEDLAAARERVAALPEPLRSDVLRQDLFSKLKGGNEKEVADLIRSNAGSGNAAKLLAQSSASLVLKGGYEHTGQFLKTIEANTEERNAIAAQAVSLKLTSDDWMQNEPASTIATARNWALQEAPEAAERITGDALGRLAINHFDEAAKLALQYQESGGNDAVLMAFLQSNGAKVHRNEARPLVDRIADPVKREEVRKLFPVNKP